jgi:hypothetical protein
MWDQQRGMSRDTNHLDNVSNARGSQGSSRRAAREVEGADARERAAGVSSGVSSMRFPSAALPQFVPDADDAVEGDEPDALDGLDAPDALPPGEDPRSVIWLRIRARKLIREFLRAVPRAEPEATIAIIRPDGVTRILTRAELSAAIDRLRPRQRQIIRLGVEERWPRPKVCAYLHNISMKTFERDQVEALDILIQL